jgi:hypothetical protein
MPADTSRDAWRALLDVLRDADPPDDMDEIDAAAGYRHLTHLLSYAFDLYLEADPLRPHFTPLASPTRKILGDNVDSVYHFAPLDGRRAYRIRGVRGNEVYLAFCIHGGPADGRWSERVVANVSQRDLACGPDGAFELLLGPGGIALAPDAVCVIARQYFADPGTARPASFTIEALEPPPPPPPLDDAATAARLRAVTAFVRETLQVTPMPPLPPNTLLPPMPWSPEGRGWGTPDNVYALGTFRLEPDQALVVEGRSPACTYWGVQLWNRYMQSLDYRHHRVSVNGTQAVLEPDGSFRVVIARADPGVPNWLDTAGHREGIFFCRWLQAERMPEPPVARLVPLAAVRG